ncbi:MAG: hypothetical protein IPH87_28335 [Anaerolineae bacterium]|nr:hypothetical protein [Anaerolineae bacterium]
MPPLAQADVLGLLRRLINKSLVTVERSAEGGTRYRFLEAIREFARQRLAESGEEAALADRHLAWFVALAERAEPRLKSAQQLFWLAVLDQEQENIRAALSHSLARGSVEEGLRLVGALGHFWEMRHHLVEGGRWGARLLDAAQGRAELIHSPWRAKALFTAGVIAVYQFEDERARVHLEESVRIYRELGTRPGPARPSVSLPSPRIVCSSHNRRLTPITKRSAARSGPRTPGGSPSTCTDWPTHWTVRVTVTPPPPVFRSRWRSSGRRETNGRSPILSAIWLCAPGMPAGCTRRSR